MMSISGLRTLCGGVFAFVAISFSAFSQGQYSVVDLGTLKDLPGRTDSGPTSLNRNGAVAGANVTNGTYRAMIYNGVWRDLGTLGGNESLAGGINDSNWVVGCSQITTGGTNAFAWSMAISNGVPGNPQMLDLGTLGGPVSEAFAINDSAQITGYSDVAARPSPQQHAFLYSAGSMRDIGASLTRLPNSFGYTINAAGQVAGVAYDVAYTAPHAIFFDGTSVTELGTFGGMGATPLALNDRGVIAGYLTTTNLLDRAFVYQAGNLTDLGTLGGDYSYARGINNSNLVVGGSFVDSSNVVYHAFVWQGGLMQDLNNLLDATGTGWILIEARGVNDQGQITGVGQLGGVSHGFLLSPLVTTTTLAAPQLKLTWDGNSQWVLQFDSVSGARYTVQTNGAASSSGWGNSGPVLIGTGGILSVTNSGSGQLPLFLRVEASKP